MLTQIETPGRSHTTRKVDLGDLFSPGIDIGEFSEPDRARHPRGRTHCRMHLVKSGDAGLELANGA